MTDYNKVNPLPSTRYKVEVRGLENEEFLKVLRAISEIAKERIIMDKSAARIVDFSVEEKQV